MRNVPIRVVKGRAEPRKGPGCAVDDSTRPLTRLGSPGLRRAFTLFEILLVLAIVVMLASLTIPAVQTMLTDSRVVASADIVRGRLADTRSRALDDGRPWRFACVPNTGVFQLAPETSSAWDSVAMEPDEQADLVRDELPPGIIFAQSSSDILGANQAGAPGAGWVTIGTYLADGTARDDVTFYFGHAGVSPLCVQLRGMTGTAVIQDAASMKAGQP